MQVSKAVRLLRFTSSNFKSYLALQASFVFGKGRACTEDEISFTLEAILRPNCQ